ncbi:hypothetical protein A3848_23870 [Paenibacillus sp. P32E]|nr:hypothetical protein A3848_23870 [Paenibacillus sp. P32E]
MSVRLEFFFFEGEQPEKKKWCRIPCSHSKRGETEAKGTCFVKDCECSRVDIVSAVNQRGFDREGESRRERESAWGMRQTGDLSTSKAAGAIEFFFFLTRSCRDGTRKESISVTETRPAW